MNEEEIKKKAKNNEWQYGLSLFVQLSGWLVGPLVAALFLGKWLDNKYGTEPWWFIICLSVAFLITSFGIVRETMGFIRRVDKEVQKSKKEINDRERNSSKSN